MPRELFCPTLAYANPNDFHSLFPPSHLAQVQHPSPDPAGRGGDPDGAVLRAHFDRTGCANGGNGEEGVGLGRKFRSWGGMCGKGLDKDARGQTGGESIGRKVLRLAICTIPFCTTPTLPKLLADHPGGPCSQKGDHAGSNRPGDGAVQTGVKYRPGYGAVQTGVKYM